MGFKQPRVPEYREAEGVGAYMRNLTLFLKDFCMDCWKATMNLERASGMDEAAAGAFVLRYVYPVGSVYASLDGTDPQERFGGTWERIAGRFLLGADETHGAGTTGGTERVTLEAAQMPRHGHIETLHVKGKGYGFMTGDTVSEAAGENVYSFEESTLDVRANTGVLMSTRYAGGSEAHENMPPYLAVHMWRRTA